MNLYEELESELDEELLVGFLPERTRVQRQAKGIVKEIVKSIFPLIRHTSEKPFEENPNSYHLRCTLCLYHEWKVFRTSSVIENYFETKLMGYLLKLCYYWSINDFCVVDEVILYFHKCYGDFREVVHAVVDENGTWKTLFQRKNWLSPVNGRQHHINGTPLSYCLFVTNSSRLTLDGRRFVDVPFILIKGSISAPVDCFHKAKYKKLLLLLQYGASVSGLDWWKWEAHMCFKLMFEMLLKLRNDSAILVPSGRSTSEGYGTVLSCEYWMKKIQCGRILMRVTPQMSMYLRGDDMTNTAKTILSILSNYIPSVANSLTELCKLKHLCRLMVRRILKLNWGLPHGIESLRIPQQLKNYLNLLED